MVIFSRTKERGVRGKTTSVHKKNRDRKYNRKLKNNLSWKETVSKPLRKCLQSLQAHFP